jgi:hypothetical protein
MPGRRPLDPDDAIQPEPSISINEIEQEQELRDEVSLGGPKTLVCDTRCAMAVTAIQSSGSREEARLQEGRSVSHKPPFLIL